MRLHPKSNAIAKQGEQSGVEERLLQVFKDEQKETEAEWIKDGKIPKRNESEMIKGVKKYLKGNEKWLNSALKRK